MKPEKEHMESLATALGAYPPTRDGCGDYVIEGKNGNIHADGDGYSVYFNGNSKKHKNSVKRTFRAVLNVKQDGDTEFVAFLSAGLRKSSVCAMLRKNLAIPKRKELSAEGLAKLIEAGKATRIAKK